MDTSPTPLPPPGTVNRMWRWVIGKARSPREQGVFHKLSLIAFFAWVGLGADGLSSCCYGPEEAFRALGTHTSLSIFVALGTVLTVLIISTSYSQIIELFPSGGGGYLVASKLLSPGLGLVAGSALMIDYVLTITLSVASGADALFSYFPAHYIQYKLTVAIVVLIVLTTMNLRGVKESVVPLVPIFMVFVLTHVFFIVYAVVVHLMNYQEVAQATMTDMKSVERQLGMFGMIILVLRAYSMGAGTYTGIEAVSNAMPMLREPKVETGRHTMRYMAFSLSFMVLGLMVTYLLYKVVPASDKTLNAIVVQSITQNWHAPWGTIFIFVVLVSEAAILFVAAQTGFMGGPAVLANMSLDRWFPTRFANLSDRLVTQNGIILMGGAGLILMILSHGSVRFMVILYSINVFITFVLSQSGMVRHWWMVRNENPKWLRKLLINGTGLVLCVFILISVIVLKFDEGGWITLAVTATLIAIALVIRRHYAKTKLLLKRLDDLVKQVEAAKEFQKAHSEDRPLTPFDAEAKTAVLLVNGYNGLGLHTLLSVIQHFGGTFHNFVFVEIGVVDAGNFKGVDEVDKLRLKARDDTQKYVDFMQRQGYNAATVTAVGIDVVAEITKLAPSILDKYPRAVFFGGQLVFPEDTLLTRWLHNYIVFAIQRGFYHQGIPFIILPIRVGLETKA